jgi:integrase
MTVHGFRALAMTALKERLDYPHDVIDRQLAHAPRDPLRRAYDRAEFIQQRRKMMQAWSDYLERKELEGLSRLPYGDRRRKKAA